MQHSVIFVCLLVTTVFQLIIYASRYTAATLLLSLEVPIETVSKILGHADIKTTQIYARVIDKSKRAAMDKLDGLTD